MYRHSTARVQQDRWRCGLVSLSHACWVQQLVRTALPPGRHAIPTRPVVNGRVPARPKCDRYVV
jgi:hypothetical protein